MFATDQDAESALEKANGVSIELPEISFPDRPIRLMYAEAPDERVALAKQEQNENENQE